jgi:death on curing protein
MKEPIFLTIEEILKTHQRSIELYGGSYGVRDFESLLSAINVPSSTFDGFYLHADLYSMAAAYLFHLVKNHPFIDGNKRIGLRAALLFLYLNGIQIEADPDEITNLVLSVVMNDISKAQLADYFRTHANKINP